MFGDLDVGIGAEHAPELGVVEAAVHVDDAAVIEHFVTGTPAKTCSPGSPSGEITQPAGRDDLRRHRGNTAIIVLRTAAEGIAIGLAVCGENLGIKRKVR